MAAESMQPSLPDFDWWINGQWVGHLCPFFFFSLRADGKRVPHFAEYLSGRRKPFAGHFFFNGALFEQLTAALTFATDKSSSCVSTNHDLNHNHSHHQPST